MCSSDLYTIHGNIPVNSVNNEGFVETFLTLDSDSVLTKSFNPRLINIPSNVTIIFSEVKLEKGVKSTSWLPAPEDMVLYNPDGNVGIGATSPGHKLVVEGSSSSYSIASRQWLNKRVSITRS